MQLIASMLPKQINIFNKLAFYEEGEQTGRLLGKIVQSQQLLHNKVGKVVNTPVDFYLYLTSINLSRHTDQGKYRNS